MVDARTPSPAYAGEDLGNFFVKKGPIGYYHLATSQPSEHSFYDWTNEWERRVS
jgi:hypothetical protein